MGSVSWLGFINHQQSHLSHTLVSPKEEPTSRHGSSTEGEPGAARQSREQAAFLAVAFRMKQLRGSLLSPSEAKSPVHITLNAPKPRGEQRRRGGGTGVEVGVAPAPGDLPQKAKSTSSQCPLQEEAQPFSPNFGAFQKGSEQWNGRLSHTACCVPRGTAERGTGTRRPACPSPGACGKEAILHIDVCVASLQERGVPDSMAVAVPKSHLK